MRFRHLPDVVEAVPVIEGMMSGMTAYLRVCVFNDDNKPVCPVGYDIDFDK